MNCRAYTQFANCLGNQYASCNSPLFFLQHGYSLLTAAYYPAIIAQLHFQCGGGLESECFYFFFTVCKLVIDFQLEFTISIVSKTLAWHTTKLCWTATLTMWWMHLWILHMPASMVFLKSKFENKIETHHPNANVTQLSPIIWNHTWAKAKGRQQSNRCLHGKIHYICGKYITIFTIWTLEQFSVENDDTHIAVYLTIL